jgi:hypothetical protein
MGATATTPANLVIGAGDVEADGTDFGVTADDNTYRIEQEIFAPDNLNGVPGALIGTHYKIKEEAILEVTVPEVSAQTVALMWPGSTSTVLALVTTIDTDGTNRRIPSADYHDYVLTVPGLDGASFAFLADAALNQGTLEFNGQNAGMMAPRLELHSMWDASDLTASPHRIVITAAA